MKEDMPLSYVKIDFDFGDKSQLKTLSQVFGMIKTLSQGSKAHVFRKQSTSIKVVFSLETSMEKSNGVTEVYD